MLKLVDIKKDYRVADNLVHALKGVSLEFRRNEFVSILGASGCGKTTLLNIIGGLDHYTSGDLIVLNKSTKNFKDADWDVYRNHRIGFIFQSYNLIPHQNVLSNVEMALTIAGISSEERKRRAEEALIKVGLKDHLYKKPNQLSGGQAQRVAIARALVNNPEILLADEPTGALDSETSVQIMELIKEIAGERLVIMVTHNPYLARKYSTRIVELSDGLVISDSNPFDSSKEEDISPVEAKKTKAKKEKASMSFFTALRLSARNLVSKKGRTAVTAVAGSIGIIGVSLVLALSAGINAYIDDMQQDMLSAYPVTVSETSMDFSSILDGGTSMKKDDIEHLDDRVYVNSMLTSIAGGVTVTNDITEEYISYVKAMPEEYCYDVQFGYSNDVTNNIYTSFTDSSGEEKFVSLSSLYMTYQTLLMNVDGGKYQSLGGMLSMLGGVTHELPDNEEYILSQYDIIGEYPSSSDEVAIVINSNGELSDVVLAQLGYFTQDEFMDYAEESENTRAYFTDEEILGKEYTYYPNDSIYSINTTVTEGVETTSATYSSYMDSLNEENGVKLKITAILRVKDGINYGALSTGLNYTAEFTQKYMDDNSESEIVSYIKNAISPAVTYFYDFVYDGTSTTIPAQKTLTSREVGGETLPNSVYFYSVDFEAKDLVTDYLDKWNDEHENNTIKYTDTLALIISMVKTMMNAVTYALVAFTAISLVVSTVMIGVITYVSVVERTKEIGILRALGARKKDIKHLFNAETFIIGLIAGLFGIGVTYLLSIPINILIKSLTGIAAIAALPYYEAIIMVAISVGLTLISGLFPATAAARRDPVVALRTE